MAESSGPRPSNRTRRVIGTLFGIFFLAVALLTLATSDASNRLAAIVVAVVIGGLGLDLIVSVWRGRRSLLSRIGPLP